jgi:D-serine deaminase-like pyridoxal phosphate-dependent protein
MKTPKAKRSTLIPFIRSAGSNNADYLSAPVDTIKTGIELGQRVSVGLGKSVQSILDVACCVSRACALWYEPWRTVGRKKKSRERKAADKHWEDFLTEAGWDFPRHAKLIGKLATIGNRAQLLSVNSANLPNSVETLALISDKSIPSDQVARVVAGLSAASTTRNAMTVMKKLGIEAPKKPAKNALYGPSLTVKATIAEDNIVQLAAFLALSRHLKFDLPDLSLLDELRDQVLADLKTIEEHPLFQDFVSFIDSDTASRSLKRLRKAKKEQQGLSSRFQT